MKLLYLLIFLFVLSLYSFLEATSFDQKNGCNFFGATEPHPIIKHLEEYRAAHQLIEIDTSTRYILKEVGSHFLVDSLDLTPRQKKTLKELLSRRLLCEEALACEIIPALYLEKLLDSLPKELKKFPLTQAYIN